MTRIIKVSSKEKLKIVVDYSPSQADNDVVREGIIASNEHIVGERDKAFSIFLKNNSGKVFGGIQAFRDTESTYIDVLWVEENLQRQGYGTKLLGAAEREAIENGCIFSLVDTWDFQAEEFYLKNGYERISEIKNYWHGHSKIFLRKKLKSTQVTALDFQIRPLVKSDIPQIVKRYSFPWSTQDKTETLWATYYQEQKNKVRTVAVIEKSGEILGYGSLLRKPECPFFTQRNIPEINAVWIGEDHRRKGLGTALIKWLETLASQEGYNEIGIGVGLYRDYGPAQQLYFQLGYLPEGNGITYKGQPTIAGQSYPLDDDLLLWLVKPLKWQKET
jgi:GNAT superfamily N-acetyltransferase